MRDPNDARRLEDRVLTVPNALSLARLFMVPGVVALLLARADGLAAALFVLAAVTDFLDGRLARRAAPTRLGRILDPVADRLMLSQRCGGASRAGALACMGWGISSGEICRRSSGVSWWAVRLGSIGWARRRQRC